LNRLRIFAAVLLLSLPSTRKISIAPQKGTVAIIKQTGNPYSLNLKVPLAFSGRNNHTLREAVNPPPFLRPDGKYPYLIVTGRPLFPSVLPG
jgi:hypothetical protein